MRCLQCGVEMALKKLRNSTEFCSEDCGRKYQDESNQQAVSRLMQQRKPKGVRAAVSAGRFGEAVSVATTVIAVTEPPLGEFLPQKVWAILEAHPVSPKVDWQLRKGSQVMPALSGETMTSMLALAFANINDTYGPRGPRVGVIDEYLSAEPLPLWPLKADGRCTGARTYSSPPEDHRAAALVRSRPPLTRASTSGALRAAIAGLMIRGSISSS